MEIKLTDCFLVCVCVCLQKIFFPVECLSRLIECSAEAAVAKSSDVGVEGAPGQSTAMPQSYGKNSEAGRHVLSMLQRGPSGAAALCRQITRVTRFEHTTEGIRLVVHGAEMPYSVSRSAEEQQLEREEREGAATRIQALYRGVLGRERVKLMASDKSRWDHMQRVASARAVRFSVILTIMLHSLFVANNLNM
jgi:hypothetical protein